MGELVVRVLQLMTFINNRLEQSNGHESSEKLDLAMLNFFDQFRKIFIGDHVQKSSKVYQRMSELLGIQDEAMWLNLVTSKIINNLKFWTRSERIISKTLTLLNDLSRGLQQCEEAHEARLDSFLARQPYQRELPIPGLQQPAGYQRNQVSNIFLHGSGPTPQPGLQR